MLQQLCGVGVDACVKKQCVCEHFRLGGDLVSVRFGACMGENLDFVKWCW